jgi:hypothetical protein
MQKYTIYNLINNGVNSKTGLRMVTRCQYFENHSNYFGEEKSLCTVNRIFNEYKYLVFSYVGKILRNIGGKVFGYGSHYKTLCQECDQKMKGQ